MVNDKDCEQFLTDLIAAYPTIESLAKSSSPDLAATHRSWAKAWQDLTLADCLEVLDQLQRGLIDQPSFEDKESPGVWIRRLVQRLNGHKSEAEIASILERSNARKRRQQEYAASGHSVTKAFEALKAGASIEEFC